MSDFLIWTKFQKRKMQITGGESENLQEAQPFQQTKEKIVGYDRIFP
jgi:hypothetical protein